MVFLTDRLGLQSCLLGNFPVFCRLLFFFLFSKSTFSKYSFRNTTRVSNSLDPEQAKCFVKPDLGPNCLQKLSADDISLQRVFDNFITKNAFL